MTPEKEALWRAPNSLLKSSDAPEGGMTPLSNHLINAWREIEATFLAGELHLLCNQQLHPMLRSASGLSAGHVVMRPKAPPRFPGSDIACNIAHA